MDIAPGFSQFASVYEEGRPQALYARLIADLETPVSAFLKLAEGRANAFLLEENEHLKKQVSKGYGRKR